MANRGGGSAVRRVPESGKVDLSTPAEDTEKITQLQLKEGKNAK